MIAALFLQYAAAEPLPRDVWASISAHAALDRTSRVIEFVRDANDQSESHYTLRLTTRYRDDPPTIMWATSRTCGAVRDAVARLKTLPFPQVELPGDTVYIALDGVGYSVRFTATYGSLTEGPMQLNSNLATPLAEWVEGTFAVLRPCWSPVRLIVKRKP